MEAMERLRLQQFGKWCAVNKVDVDFEGIGTHVIELRSNCTKQNLETFLSSKAYQQLFDLYNDFCANHYDPMFQFWSSYIDLVLLLMRFMRATKGHKSGWQLQLACIRDMLPWAFAYDRVNYSRYLSLYCCEMSCLSTTHPAANHVLHEGQFAVQRCRNTLFGQVATDQTTEQTVYRDMKTKGGIIGFSRRQGPVQRWMITSHDRAAISYALQGMAGVLGEVSSVHKECQKTRAQADEGDVVRLLETSESWINRFR